MRWPDLIVAAIMATLGTSGGMKIIRLAWNEMTDSKSVAGASA